MKKIIVVCFLVVSNVGYADTEFFYCGYSDLGGSGQDYSKWGKGTDFKYNDAKERWEWVSEYTEQFIYLDGRYEQKALVSFMNNQKGVCNGEMEKIYKRKLQEAKAKYK